MQYMMTRITAGPRMGHPTELDLLDPRIQQRIEEFIQ
jgi:hypothetical protein